MDFSFKKCSSLNIGIELELFIVDSTTYNLKRVRDKILAEFPQEDRKYIKKEYFQSIIEIVSPVFNSLDEIAPFFDKIFNQLKNAAKIYDAKIIGLGTHPFAKITDAKPTPDKRYEKLKNELQMVLDRFLIFGMHIHIGLPDEVAAVNVYNHTLKYMPLMLALSTSSPFFEGKNTGLHSYRSLIFENLPRGGVPEYLYNYEDFINSTKLLYHHNFIEKYNDLWWDVRIRPDYGTVELRICDSTNDINRILAITSLYYLIAKNFYNKKCEKLFYPVLKQNKWNAIRYSLEGSFILNDKKEKINTLIKALIEKHSNTIDNKYLKLINDYAENKSISYKLVENYNKFNNLLNLCKLGEI